MPKVNATCLAKMTQAEKDLNAWKLNWVLGREYYRAQQDGVGLALWDGTAWANFYPNPNKDFTVDDPNLSAFRTQVKPGFEANTPGWNNDTCTMDLRDLACVAYFLAQPSTSDAVRATFVELMKQYDADIPYIQTTCPVEVTALPEYQPGFDFNAPPSEVPPIPGPGTPTTTPPVTVPPGPGQLPTPTGGTTPVGVTQTTEQTNINWWLWGSLAAVVVGGAALIGFARPAEVVYDNPRRNPGWKNPALGSGAVVLTRKENPGYASNPQGKHYRLVVTFPRVDDAAEDQLAKRIGRASDDSTHSSSRPWKVSWVFVQKAAAERAIQAAYTWRNMQPAKNKSASKMTAKIKVEMWNPAKGKGARQKHSEGAEIVDNMARVVWAMYWADREEEKGRSFGGVDIFDAAPATHPAAKKWALKQARKLAEMNGLDVTQPYAAMEELYARAVAANDAKGRRSEPAHRFGSDLGLMIVGSGVSWFDDNEKFDLKKPYSEFWI